MSNGRYTITCDPVQMQVIRDALDFYERVLGLGQLEEIDYHWRSDADIKHPDFDLKSQSIRYALWAAKSVGWGYSPNASGSIRSEKVPKRFRIAYDITQKIRKCMSDTRISECKQEGDEETASFLSITRDQNEYWPVFPEQGPIEIVYLENQVKNQKRSKRKHGLKKDS